MSTSIRTCIGCRQRGDAASMVRLALDGDRPVPRLKGRPPGRGASIHPLEACVRTALRTGAFARAFKRRVSNVEVRDLEKQTFEVILQQITTARTQG